MSYKSSLEVLVNVVIENGSLVCYSIDEEDLAEKVEEDWEAEMESRLELSERSYEK